MVTKIILVLALAVVGSHSQGIREVQLPDTTTTHISNPVIAKTIGIGILFLDKLVSCHVIFPSGILYELYPEPQTLTHSTMINMARGAGAAFPGCGMAFLNAPESLSGTYEVLSLVEHADGSGQTLSRQRNHITFVPTDIEFPFKDLVQAKQEVKTN